jgi:putative DNA primase/helicase
MRKSSQQKLSAKAFPNSGVLKMVDEFQSAMQAAGIICKEQIIADGLLHRFSPDGKGNPDAWYVLFELAGAYGDWSQGIKGKWSAKSQGLSYQQKNDLQAQIDNARKCSDEERKRKNEETAHIASQVWQNLTESGHSNYLARKQVNGCGIRFGEQFIVIPLSDTEGKLWSLQKIYDDGTKKFLPGGRKKGCFHHLGTLKNGESIYVVEGYSTGASVYSATNQTTVIAFDAGNIDPVIGELKAKYPNSSITIAADNDQWKEHNTGKMAAEATAKKWNCNVALPHFKDCTTLPSDFNDLMLLEGQEEVNRQLKINVIGQSILRPINVWDLLRLDIPPREMILAPIIPAQGLAMLYAPRGLGKTHVALSIAYTVAHGTQMFNGKWQCEKARKVLFIDGEMPAIALQDRIGNIIASTEGELIDYDFLQFITPDLQQENGIPDLATSEGQSLIEKHLDGVDLLILDNLSALCRTGRENESESWIPIQDWLLKLRRQGKSVLFVHHSNKMGNQRGTSKKEDLLDTVFVLRKPADYEAKQGARFEVHYEKTRGFYGDEAMPFEASLKEHNGTTFWQVRDLEDYQAEKIIGMSKEGLSQRDIAQEMGISASTVNRTIKRAKEEGRLNG